MVLLRLFRSSRVACPAGCAVAETDGAASAARSKALLAEPIGLTKNGQRGAHQRTRSRVQTSHRIEASLHAHPRLLDRWRFVITF